ncbi:hypothetical protein D3C87_1834270 [compost metagenome]
MPVPELTITSCGYFHSAWPVECHAAFAVRGIQPLSGVHLPASEVHDNSQANLRQSKHGIF